MCPGSTRLGFETCQMMGSIVRYTPLRRGATVAVVGATSDAEDAQAIEGVALVQLRDADAVGEDREGEVSRERIRAPHPRRQIQRRREQAGAEAGLEADHVVDGHAPREQPAAELELLMLQAPA